MNPNEKELRELDAWIAEHVMGWHRMTNAKEMGIENFEAFTESELEHINELSDSWYDSENKPVADVSGECDCGQHDTGWKPATDPAAAMEVLKKCNQRISIKFHQFNPQNSGEISISAVATPSSPNILIHAETLELAICFFAKKLFKK